MRQTRYSIGFTAVAVILVIVTGCGGGGSGSRGSISGTVTDAAGNFIPGATVEVIEQNRSTKSLFNGVYKIDGVQPDWVNVKATATVNGQTWTGIRAVNVYFEGPTQSMNIVIGPVTQLGEFRGAVTNASGRPLEGVRIFASAESLEGVTGFEQAFTSMVAFTDSSGHYTLSDVPSRMTVGGVDRVIRYKLVASYAGVEGMPIGFENSESFGILDPLPAYTVANFALAVSTDIVVPTPDPWTLDITSWTLPANILSRSPGAYDAIRARLSKDYARGLAKRTAVKRSPPSGSVIEIDVSWYDSWTAFFGTNLPTNLAGFSIYRREGSPPTLSDPDLIDFVRDPLLSFYGDTDSSLWVGRRYFYGVTAVSTSYLDQFDRFNPDSESVMSDVADVIPIGQVSSISPANSASVSISQLQFSWRSVAGANSYQVFMYPRYPVVDGGGSLAPDYITPAWASAVVGGTSVDYDGLPLSDNTPVTPGTYYWVVVASSSADLGGPSYSISELRSVVIR